MFVEELFPDSACEITTLVFDNVDAVDAGLGDSIAVCSDTSRINLYNLLSGYQAGGNWLDIDTTGALFGTSDFDPGIVSPGVYKFAYKVTSSSQYCGDSTVVTINVLPDTASKCCKFGLDPSITDALCFGDANGFLQVLDTISRATDYQLDGSPFQSSSLFTGLTQGTYEFVAMYGAGACTDTLMLTVDQPDSLEINQVIDSISCLGESNGQVLLNTIGGTLPYTYTVNGSASQSSNTFSGLSQGPITMVVTDANACITVEIDTVYEPSLLVLSLDTTIGASCNFNNGEIRVNAVGGNLGAKTYTLSGTASATNTTGLFTNLAFGTYAVTVTDAKGCSDNIINISIDDLGVPVASILLAKDLNCNGSPDGEIIVGVTGGTAPYQYENVGFTTMQPDSNHFKGLDVNSYKIRVQDANGCLDSVTQIINEPAEFTLVDTNLIAPTCNGICDASLEIQMTGGTLPYNVNGTGFNSGSSTTITSLCEGVYTTELSDANGCGFAVLSNVNIIAPPLITVTPSVSNVVCYEESNGQINLNAIGGSGTFEYSIDGGLNFLSGYIIPNLDANFHSIILRDASATNCFLNETIEVTQPDLLEIDTLSTTDAICRGVGGYFEVEVSGGNGIDYDIQSVVNGTTILVTDATILNTSSIVGGISSGIYYVTATDDLGCTATQSVGVSDNSLDLDIDDISIDSVSCYGLSNGSAEITPNGGIPIPGAVNGYYYYLDTVSLANREGGVNFDSFTYDNLPSGQYTIGVQDNAGCLAFDQFYVEEPEKLRIQLSGTNLTCNDLNGSADGMVEITDSSGGSVGFFTGGAYEYSLDNETYQNSQIFNNRTAGMYKVYVRDKYVLNAPGRGEVCVDSNFVIITEPNKIKFDYISKEILCFDDDDSFIFIQNTTGGSNSGFQYSLDTGATFSPVFVFSNLSAQDYTITIQDNNGCQLNSVISITEPSELLIDNSLTVVSNLNCFESCDGQITYTVNGGTVNTSYFYSLDGGVTFTSDPNFSGLCAGSYNAIVRDDNGCTDTVNTPDVITEPTKLVFDAVTSIDATCGEDNAELNLTASGGTTGILGAGFYNFSIDTNITKTPADGTIGINYPNLEIGRYYISVEDDNGCIKDTSLILRADALPVLTGRVTSTPLCFGGNEGAVEITGNSGTGSTTYLFSNDGIVYTPEPSDVVNYNSLVDGSYTYYMRDANACEDTVTLVVEQPDDILFASNNVAIKDLTCFDDNSGEIEISVSGGTPFYEYSIDGGTTFSGSNTFINLQADSFLIAVRDIKGCSFILSDSIAISQPGDLFNNLISTLDPTCFNLANGEIVIDTGYTVEAFPTPLGNSPIIDVEWSAGVDVNNNGGNLIHVTGLSGKSPNNSYSVIVINENGCQKVEQAIIINEPALAVLDDYSASPVLCFADSNGLIALESTSADFFEISKVNNNSSNTLVGQVSVNDTLFDLPTGYYEIIPKTLLCSSNGRKVKNIYVGTPDLLEANVVRNDTAICAYQDFNTPIGSRFGGTSPFTFNWEVDSTGVFLPLGSGSALPTIQAGAPGTSFNLRLTVVDVNGCMDDTTEIFNVANSPSIDVTSMPDTTFCAGGVILLTPQVTGGVGDYIYDWNNGVDFDDNFEKAIYSDSTIILSISDECNVLYGIPTINDTVQAFIVTANGVSPVVNTNVYCPGIPIEISSSNNTDVNSYEWVVDGVTYTDSASIVTLNDPGCYDVDLTLYVGAQNCPVDTVFNSLLCINDSPVADFDYQPNTITMLNPVVNFNNLSINDTIDYIWNIPAILNAPLTDENPLVVFPEEEGIYDVWLTAINTFGCMDSTSQVVSIEPVNNVFVPNTFTPNGDGKNELFRPVLYNISNDGYQFEVYDRWGRLIFRTLSPFDGWSGDNFNEGTYVWRLIAFPNNESSKIELSGTVNLIK